MLRLLLDAGYVCRQALGSALADAEPEVEQSPRYAASKALMERYADIPIEKIPEDERELLEMAMQHAFGLSVQPSILPFAKGSAAAHKEGEAALKSIQRLRAGQPDTDLYLATSPKAHDAVSYLAEQFASRRPLGRLIVGEMGQGKSTLADAVQARAGAGHVVMLPHVVLRESRFSTYRTIVNLVLQRDLLVAAFRQIATTALVSPDSAMLEQASRAVTMPPIDKLFQGSVTYLSENPETVSPEALADDMLYVLGSWLRPNGNIREGQRFLKSIGNSPDFTIYFQNVEPMDVARAFIAFFAATRVYPVWLVDEFESYAQLKNNQRDMALGFYREMFDCLYAEHGTGALLLLATPDGQTIIRNYGGFDGRLMGAEDSTLSSTTWEVADFSAWEPDALLDYLFGLYEAGAEAGDDACQRVVEMRPVFDELFASTTFRESLTDTAALPRERIKAVLSLLDLAVDGEDAVRQSFGRLMAEPMELGDDASFSELLRQADALEQEQEEQNLTPQDEAWLSHHAGLAHDEVDNGEPPGWTEWPVDGLMEDKGDRDSSNGHVADAPRRRIPGLMADSESHADGDDSPDRSDGEGLEGGNKDKTDHPPVDGLTKAGRELLAIANLEDRAWMGWVPTPGMPDNKSQTQLIFHATGPSHTAGRLAKYRDGGGSVSELWGNLARSNNPKDKAVCAKWLYLADRTRHSELHLNALGEMLDALLVADPSIPVMMPHQSRAEADAYSERVSHLVHENKEGIKALRKKFGKAAIPAAQRYASRFPLCHASAMINPLTDIQQCRHFVYAVAASIYVLPPDPWVDRFVLHKIESVWGHRPTTSRKGVQFHTNSGKLFSMFDRRRSLATEPMATACVEVRHGRQTPEKPDWARWRRYILQGSDTPPDFVS